MSDQPEGFLCRLDDLHEGQALGCDPYDEGRDTLLIVHVEGRVRAYANSCPHLQVSMEYRKDKFMSADGRYIVCYAHNARFLPETGLCIYGPCLGESLTPVEITIGNGMVCLVDGANAAPQASVAEKK